MNAILGTKPSAPVQVDYSRRRHQPEKDDLELSAAAQVLLASIEESARSRICSPTPGGNAKAFRSTSSWS